MAKIKSKKKNNFVTLMIILSFLGLLTAGYQTVEHYFLAESFCDFSTTLSCDHVTNSIYGEFPFESGIAIALWGFLWWILLIYLLFSVKHNSKHEFYVFLSLILGLIFVVYLVLVELYLLPLDVGVIVICPLCTVQHILIIILFIMSFKLLKKPINLYTKEIFFK